MTEVNAPYKYTFPITKAFVGNDGVRRLVGAATGPEVDLEAQRVAPSLIDKWIDQINNRQIEVTYDDNHKSNAESITSDLGSIEKAWKDDSGHMIVQVMLDDDNPVAQYIHKAATRGKQYGMSIFGKATRFVDEIVSGQMVRTILDGTLERIAHTTRPVWTPSLGTVLSKAVDSAVSGDSLVSENATETKVETKTEEVTTTDSTTESGAATAPDTGNAPESTDGSAEAQPVEKAITATSKKEEKALANILKTYHTMGAQLREAGLLTEEAEKGESTDQESVTVEKSETADNKDDQIATLSKSVTDLSAIVTTLMDRVTDGSAPAALRKSEPVDPLAELTAIEDPLERLRYAMAAATGVTATLR